MCLTRHIRDLQAKIAPPMLKERVGVFSTRSPHRPNPIGITLATISSIDKKARTVFLSGVDLVDGTPVLDIKPYLPGVTVFADMADWRRSQTCLQLTTASQMLGLQLGSPPFSHTCSTCSR